MAVTAPQRIAGLRPPAQRIGPTLVRPRCHRAQSLGRAGRRPAKLGPTPKDPAKANLVTSPRDRPAVPIPRPPPDQAHRRGGRRPGPHGRLLAQVGAQGAARHPEHPWRPSRSRPVAPPIGVERTSAGCADTQPRTRCRSRAASAARAVAQGGPGEGAAAHECSTWNVHLRNRSRRRPSP